VRLRRNHAQRTCDFDLRKLRGQKHLSTARENSEIIMSLMRISDRRKKKTKVRGKEKHKSATQNGCKMPHGGRTGPCSLCTKGKKKPVKSQRRGGVMVESAFRMTENVKKVGFSQETRQTVGGKGGCVLKTWNREKRDKRKSRTISSVIVAKAYAVPEAWQFS